MEQLSDLIGTIYDCVLDPHGWPDAMRRICGEIDCELGALMLLDVARPSLRFLSEWNIDPIWQARYANHVQDIAHLNKSDPEAFTRPIDEPVVLSRHVPENIWRNTAVYKEWAKPQGLCDSIHVVVLRKHSSIGVFAGNRHETVGPATDREVDILRFLAPHIRRAVTIGDLLDLKSLERQALASSLDHLAAGVIIVADNQRILHANAAAETMFAGNGPLRARDGHLAATDARADGELAKAIAIARSNEAEIGAAGIGVSVSEPGGDPVIAHVLPLAGGVLRTRLMQQATAAIFVTSGTQPPELDLTAIAASFALTGAELRLLQALLAGASLVQAGAALGIAESTAKTHLSHIFAKTGVTRQADLIALLHRLTPPIVPSGAAGVSRRKRSTRAGQ